MLWSLLILYVSDGTYIIRSTPYDSFFEKLFKAIWFVLRIFGSNPGFMSNNPTDYLLDYGGITTKLKRA